VLLKLDGLPGHMAHVFTGSVNLREPTALWRRLPVRAWCGDTSAAASHVLGSGSGSGSAGMPSMRVGSDAAGGGTWMLGVLSQCDLIYVHFTLTRSVACGAGVPPSVPASVLCRSSRSTPCCSSRLSLAAD